VTMPREQNKRRAIHVTVFTFDFPSDTESCERRHRCENARNGGRGIHNALFKRRSC
jgi:hypothetical protein